MYFQFEVAAQTPAADARPAAQSESVELLRQLLEVQREQLQLHRAAAAAQDSASRWRAFLGRWRSDFPDVGVGCRSALPVIERAYVALLAELTEHLRQQPADAFDNEYTLSEFLDRYGVKLAQLGAVMSAVAPLADVAESP